MKEKVESLFSVFSFAWKQYKGSSSGNVAHQSCLRKLSPFKKRKHKCKESKVRRSWSQWWGWFWFRCSAFLMSAAYNLYRRKNRAQKKLNIQKLKNVLLLSYWLYVLNTNNTKKISKKNYLQKPRINFWTL